MSARSLPSKSQPSLSLPWRVHALSLTIPAAMPAVPAMPAVVRRWRRVLAVAMPAIAAAAAAAAIAAIAAVRLRRRGVMAVATVVRRRRRVVTRVAPPIASPVASPVASPGRGAVATLPAVGRRRGGRGAAGDGAAAAVLRGPDLGAVVHLAIEGATPPALARLRPGGHGLRPGGHSGLAGGGTATRGDLVEIWWRSGGDLGDSAVPRECVA